MVNSGPVSFRQGRVLPASFRDPSGFLYHLGNTLYRQVNASYRQDYDRLTDSGLYHRLVQSELLLPHEEVGREHAASDAAYKVLKPELIPFISYPYEWSFSQLKDAALLTLRIQKESLEFGMSLKDSSAYNVQFQHGRPLFIDILSFERYPEGRPWVAYRQFCQHFLAPLALMSFGDVRLNQLFRAYIDGIPLDLASSLLPLRTYGRFGLLVHIHLHARSQKHFAGKPADRNSGGMSRRSILGLMESLESAIQRLTWRPRNSHWSDYYGSTNYSPEAFQHKRQLVSEILTQIHPKPRVLWDLGANIGEFSRVASEKGILTLAFEMDPACVERNYLECKRNRESDLLPLLLDLTSPSPDLGWANQERMSLLSRGPADAVLALALVHHLAISNNLPLEKIATFFTRICRSLIIEFVPKSDSQVVRLLSTREDIFGDYDQSNFEREFGRFFSISRSEKIRETERTLYWMERLSEAEIPVGNK